MSSMHLALYVTETGSHLGGWRHPDARYVRPLDWNFYKDLARKAERAKIDMLFIADKLAIDDIFESSFKPTISWRPVPQHAEPLTLLAALSGATEKIGLAGTVSATYTEPYTAARMLANIDHLSQGRAGWNLVTSVSDGEARNFGKGNIWHMTRVMKKLPNSSRWPRRCGTVGKATGKFWISKAGYTAIATRCITSITPASGSMSKAR